MIDIFVLSICLSLSLMCLIMLFSAYLKQPNLSSKHPKAPAFCDLLEYATLVKGEIIVLKNGTLCRIYEFKPKLDNYLKDKEAEITRERCGQALMKLEGGWALQMDALRSHHSDYMVKFHGDNPCALYLDKERRLKLKAHPAFKTSFYLTLSYKGDSHTSRALLSLFTSRPHKVKDPKAETLKIISNFISKCDALTQTLKALGSLELLGFDDSTILRSHKALSFIRQCLYMDKLPQAFPRHHAYLDAILSCQDFQGGMCPKLGEKYIATVAIEGLPSESLFLVLSSLASLKLECRFHTRFICQDKLESSLSLLRYRRLWKQKRRGIVAQIFNIQGDNLNADAQSQLEDLNCAQQLLDAGQEIFGKYTSLIVLMDRDLETLKEKTAISVKAIESLGFGARVETLNAIEAFLGSLPGHLKYNVRRNLISSSVLCDLLPLSFNTLGESHSPNPLYGLKASSLLQALSPQYDNILINIHDKDLGNAIVIGPPGTGKSVFLGHLMFNLLRYPKMQIFCFDKGLSFYAQALALGGEIINLNAKTKLCPFEYLETPEDLNRALDFIEGLLELKGVSVDGYEHNEILEALKIIARKPEFGRGISALKLLIASRHIKDELLEYTDKTILGGILDGEHNPDLNSDFTLFECAALFDYALSEQIPILKLIFSLIARKFDGSHPGAIIIDEAWLLLKHQLCAQEVLKWIKTLRKNNVVVILATQSLSDLRKSPIYENLIDCIKTRFFLPNPDAKQKPALDDYEKLGLLPSHIDSISHGLKKSEVFMHKGESFTAFIPQLAATELKLLSLNQAEDKKRIERLYQQYGHDFYKKL